MAGKIESLPMFVYNCTCGSEVDESLLSTAAVCQIAVHSRDHVLGGWGVSGCAICSNGQEVSQKLGEIMIPLTAALTINHWPVNSIS